MSSVQQHNSALRLEESQREAFFRILLHDDRDSFYIVSSNAGGTWTDTAVKRNALSAFTFDERSNYYITQNGFSAKRRVLQKTRQINALFFDLDCHGANADEIDFAIQMTLQRLNDAVEHNVLPRPSMLVHSGRGLHLYYVLERSLPYRFRGIQNINEKGLAFFNDVRERLADVLDELIADVDNISVDRAVFDYTRVARIPGTFNTKAQRFAMLLDSYENFYHLPDLAVYRPQIQRQSLSTLLRAEKVRKPVFQAHELPEQSNADSSEKTANPRIVRFHPLMLSRLNKITELQAHRKFECEGRRDLICFSYYNTAVQVYDRKQAVQSLIAFNERFTEKLSQSELKAIVKAIDNVTNVRGEKGYYLLKADTLVRFLGLTEDEMNELHFFSSKRVVERMEAKRKTKEKRNNRDLEIIRLFKETNYTQKQIAEQIGCSARTVASVLKGAGLTQCHAVHKKPAKPSSSGVVPNHEQSSYNVKKSSLKAIAEALLGYAKKQLGSISSQKGNFSFPQYFANFWLPSIGGSVLSSSERCSSLPFSSNRGILSLDSSSNALLFKNSSGSDFKRLLWKFGLTGID